MVCGFAGGIAGENNSYSAVSGACEADIVLAHHSAQTQTGNVQRNEIYGGRAIRCRKTGRYDSRAQRENGNPDEGASQTRSDIGVQFRNAKRRSGGWSVKSRGMICRCRVKERQWAVYRTKESQRFGATRTDVSRRELEGEKRAGGVAKEEGGHHDSHRGYRAYSVLGGADQLPPAPVANPGTAPAHRAQDRPVASFCSIFLLSQWRPEIESHGILQYNT